MTQIRKIGRFGIPFMTLLSFFAACVIVAKMIADGGSNLLSEPRDQWWKYEGEHGQPYKGRFLDVRHVTIPSIVDLVDRQRHNQIINGQNLPSVTPGQLPLFR